MKVRLAHIKISGALLFLGLAAQTVEAAPQEAHQINHKEPSHTWQALPGKATFTEVASDEPDIIFCTIRQAGPHFLTLGNRLYLSNETIPQKERIKGIRNHQFVLRSSQASLSLMPSTYSTGWDAWVIRLNRAIADEWKSALPGKQDVVLEVKRDGTIRIFEPIAFTPAIGQTGSFVTAQEAPELQDTFFESIKEALANVSTATPVPFPEGSTATCAVICATFNVDKNLDVWIPDLRRLKDVPRNQRSLWIARLCSLLDAGNLYTVSDALRLELPSEARVRFVEENEFRSINAVGTACVDHGPFSQSILNMEAKAYLLKTLKEYLAKSRYLEAELLAKRVSTDCFLRTTCYGLHPPQKQKHGTSSYVEMDLQYLKAQKLKVETDFRKPVPVSRRFFI